MVYSSPRFFSPCDCQEYNCGRYAL